MAKFKAGDKVKRVMGSLYGMDAGEVDTVAGVDFEGDLHLKNFLGCHAAKNFVLVPAYPNPPHKHAESIKAWADGAEIERYSKPLNKWLGAPKPTWCADMEYRIKPSNPNADKIKELEATIAKAQEQLKELEKGL